MEATDESGKTAILKCTVQGKNPTLSPWMVIGHSEGGGGETMKLNYNSQNGGGSN